MNLTLLSNTFNALVQASDYWQSYHFGPGSDIERNVPNDYDPSGDAGKAFPHVQWAAPPEGMLSFRSDRPWIDEIEVELYCYALQDYGADGQPVDQSRTLLAQWNELKARAVELLHAIRDRKGLVVKDRTARWSANYNQHSDRLICVLLEFTVQIIYDCDDYQAQLPPLGSTLPNTIDCVNDLEYGGA